MLNKISKIFATILVFIWIWVSSFSCFGQLSLWPGGINSDEAFPFSWSPTTSDDNTDIGNRVDIRENSIMNQLLEVFWLDSDALWWDHKFLNYAKAILNMALWLLSMIALIMTIYTFYMMFFTENEAWIKKAKWNLVGIFIALAIIGLARIIVSFIFRWYQSNWQSAAL